LPRKQGVVLNVEALTLAAWHLPPVLRAGRYARNTQCEVRGDSRVILPLVNGRLLLRTGRTFE